MTTSRSVLRCRIGVFFSANLAPTSSFLTRSAPGDIGGAGDNMRVYLWWWWEEEEEEEEEEEGGSFLSLLSC
jgi:hypothetical protein